MNNPKLVLLTLTNIFLIVKFNTPFISKQADADGYTVDGKIADGYPLFDIFESWVMQMGFPLLTVKKTGANEITVSQQLFLIDPSDEPAEHENEEAKKYK